MRHAAPTAHRSSERLIGGVLLFAASLSVLTTVGIVVVIGWEAIAFFREVPLGRFFLDTVWTPLFSSHRYGIWPLVSGTLLTAAIALAVALPFGLGAAVFLAEFASRRARRWLKPALELLAGVPTVVYGYFALLTVTPALQHVVGGLSAFNALSPGLTMGVMIVPMMASVCDDALRAVPRALREGAWALGARQVPTVFRVVLPAARSGIVAAALLSAARAVGETMIVTIAAGQQPRLGLDPRQPIETMTAFIAQVSLGDVPAGSIEYRTIFAVGALLFLWTFVLNGAALRAVRRSAARRLAR